MPDRKTPGMPGRSLLFWVLLVVSAVALWLTVSQGPRVHTIGYSDFIGDVESGKIKKVTIERSEKTLFGDLDGKVRVSARYEGENIAELLRAKGANVDVVAADAGWVNQLIYWLPMIVSVLFVLLLFRTMRSQGQGAIRMIGGSKAKLVNARDVETRFSDVLGADEAVKEVQETVEFLKNPGRFKRLGARIPNGVLLMGPPGVGKTLLARAVAGEAGVPFFTISGSDFVEMFVGVGASRVRSLFEECKKKEPCILFIDEIDAVGRHRGAGLGNGHDEREQTLNQLLVEMDGFEGTSVVVFAATNRPDVLDPALIRPGRFDKKIVMTKPDVGGREQILQRYARSKPLADDVDLRLIAQSTMGWSGDDLETLVNEAALAASIEGCDRIFQRHLIAAFEKKEMGAERRLTMSDEEKKRVAVHETGHALLVRHFSPAAGVLQRVTIVPRGQALGLTWFLPEADRFLKTQEQLEASIMVAFGGRIAEELIYRNLSTGAANDLTEATGLIERMMREFGMSDALGPVSYLSGDVPTFLGRDFGERKRASEATARLIDEEIRKRAGALYAKAKRVLEEQLAALKTVAAALVEKETLQRGDIDRLLAPTEES